MRGILLPMGISCSGADLSDQGETHAELWDFVAGNAARRQ